MVIIAQLSERDGFLAVLMAVAIVLPLYAAFVIFRKRTDPHLEESDNCDEAHGFDPTPLTPRIQSLREDFAGALHVRPHPRPHAETAVAAAREMVVNLPYFQEKPPTPTDGEQPSE